MTREPDDPFNDQCPVEDVPKKYPGEHPAPDDLLTAAEIAETAIKGAIRLLVDTNLSMVHPESRRNLERAKALLRNGLAPLSAAVLSTPKSMDDIIDHEYFRARKMVLGDGE